MVAVAMAPAAPAFARAETRHFDIPAQPASSGIKAFARQAGVQILVAGGDVQGRSTNAVHGKLAVRPALNRLLAGTGVHVQSLEDGVAILDAKAASPPSETASTIIVTGSRISRLEPSAMPIRVIDMADAERFGRTSLYDALTRESAVAPGMGLTNAFGEGWDAGVASVSLRNLGTNRSLTLIDGMRRVSGSARSSAVDINMIPPALVDRVEIITGGASAIYGADAVTGAVNIITKRRVDGLNISVTNGISQRGDANELTISALTGAKFAGGRGSFVLGGTYSATAPLYYSQRYSTYLRSVANPNNTGANDGIADQISIPDFRQIYYAYQPSFYVNGQAYIVEDGKPRSAYYGETLYPGEFSYGNGGDGRNLRDADQLRGGIHIFALMGRLDYEVTDSVSYNGYFDVGVSDYRGTASFPLPRDDSRDIWFDGAGGSVAYLDNPFLPEGVRQFMQTNGLSQLSIERTYGNFPIMRELHDRRSVTVGQALDGTLIGAMRWKAFYQYGRTSDDVRTVNIPKSSHWLAARDVIADLVTGAPICRNEAARAAGCLPLDIFSEAPPTEQLKAYVLGTREERRVNTQQIWGANIVGNFMRLPAGPLSLVMGFEHRKETLDTVDDPLAATEFTYGGSGYTVHPNLDKSFDVTEAYVELAVPLLSGRPFFRSLEIEGAYRYSRYSTVGGTHTWKIGGTWAPIDGIVLRAMRSRSVRTPNFGELYEVPILKQAGSITDPCEAADYYQSETRSANCRALGIDVPLGDFKVGPVITTGGNPDLKPETSNSLTLGAVFRPAPALEATIDYWNIGIKDVITQFSYENVLNLCVDLPTIENSFCKAVDRDPTDGRVTAIQTKQINASRMSARGIDIGLRYETRVGNGRINLNLNGTYLLKQLVESTPGVITGNVKYDGDWQNPRFQGSAQAIYDIGKLSAAVSMRFISPGRYDVNAQSNEVYDNDKLPPYLYIDISSSLKITSKIKITYGVSNLTNILPPYVYPIYKDSIIYDRIGRSFFLFLSIKI